MPGWMRFGGYAAPYQQPDPESEKQALKSQAEAMQSELEAVKQRLAELETSTASK
jgi:prefoldin subunit 5